MATSGGAERKARPLQFCVRSSGSNADDRLDALEAVFPRHHQAQGCPVLVWQILVVETDRQDGERVYGFVETQALDVRPIEGLEKAALARHLARPFKSLEGDELSVSLRLGTLDHIREREANPGMTIDQPSTQRWR